jgi:hypothetical protein
MEENTCEAILTRDINRGKKCGMKIDEKSVTGKYCRRHLTKERIQKKAHISNHPSYELVLKKMQERTSFTMISTKDEAEEKSCATIRCSFGHTFEKTLSSINTQIGSKNFESGLICCECSRIRRDEEKKNSQIEECQKVCNDKGHEFIGDQRGHPQFTFRCGNEKCGYIGKTNTSNMKKSEHGVCKHCRQKEYGSNCDAEKLEKVMMEKYGVRNPMHVPEFVQNTLRASFRKKPTEVCGVIHNLMGYEPIAIKYLSTHKNPVLHRLINPSELLFEGEVQHFPYFDEKKKDKVYYPDFEVKGENLIIEVKSTYIFNRTPERNILKFQEVASKGKYFPAIKLCMISGFSLHRESFLVCQRIRNLMKLCME